MKIGIIATSSKVVNINAVGGTEVFCATLAQGLIKLGHDVLLFATEGSHVQGAKLVVASDRTQGDVNKLFFSQYGRDLTTEEKSIIDINFSARLLLKAKEFDNEVDVFHDNISSFLTGSLSDLFRSPIVTTMHMPPTTYDKYLTIPPLITKPTNKYIAISKWEQASAQVESEVIYNGINVNDYTDMHTYKDHLIWIGRISPRTPKGLKEAIEVGRKTGKQLLFSGFVSDQGYYNTEIEPNITDQAKRVPIFTSIKDKNLFYSSALVALFPIMWEEPFGLVFVETMASGTPIIAFARGAVPEVIVDGVTGFIINPSDEDIRGKWIIKKTGLDGLCEAVERIYSLSKDDYGKMREACRAHVENNFTMERMVKEYESVYSKLISEQKNSL
jgi:glycosyltransferase involved in cell wall biosynthesis